MQEANGLQLKMSEASYSSLVSGLVLGYSCHPHSIINYEKTLAKTNMDEIRKKIHLAQKVSSLDNKVSSLILLWSGGSVHCISQMSKKNSYVTNGKYNICLKQMGLRFTNITDFYKQIKINTIMYYYGIRTN